MFGYCYKASFTTRQESSSLREVITYSYILLHIQSRFSPKMIDMTKINHSTVNMTERLLLQEINDIYASYRIGGLIFVSVLMILGIIGNCHVLYIYILKFPKTNRRLYLVCLGVLDLTMCTVAMPFTIIDLRYPLIVDNMLGLCKTRRFFTYFICCAAGSLLVIIAYDRYCKICHPLRSHISYIKAKWLCVIAILVSGLFTWPAAVLFGRRTFNTHYGVEGTICSTRHIYDNYMLCFNIILVILLVLAGGALLAFYVKISQAIFKHEKKTVTKFTTLTKQSQEYAMKSVETSKESLSGKQTNDSSIVVEDEDSFCAVQDLAADVPKRSKWGEVKDTVKPIITVFRDLFRKTIVLQLKDNQKDGHSINAKRTTVMLMIIAIIYIASYVPYLVLTSIVLARHDYLESLSFTDLSLYFTFMWVFYINNMINPIIYTLCDRRYRKQLMQMYSFCFPSHENVV